MTNHTQIRFSTPMKTILLLLTILSIAIVFQSCGDDPIKGCTDSEAETFNPDATEADNSACVYSRDKFVGTYAGNFFCPNLANPLTGELLVTGDSTYTFQIEEKGSGGANDLAINLEIAGNSVAIDGTASGDVLTVNTTITGVYVEQLMSTVDITMTGDATLAGDKLEGVMNVVAKLSGLTVTDNCPLEGTKQ